MTQRRPQSDMPEGEFKQEKDKDVEIDPDDSAMQDAVRGMAIGERYVKLYRINDQGGRPRLLESLLPQDFNETYVQARFGGGRFHARWMDSKGKYYKYPFEIEGRSKNPEDEEEEEGEQPVFIPNNAPAAAAPPAGPSFLEIIALLTEARKEARDENMLMMKMMLERSQPAAAPADGIDRTLSFVKELIPIIGQGGGGGGEPLPWYANVLLQLKDPLTKLLDTASTVASQYGKNPQAIRPTGPIANPPAQAVESHPEPDMIASQFKLYLPVLLRGAAKNTDPTVYVDMILDQIPQMAYDPLRKWLLEPGCLDKLVQLEPAIQYQQEWWESLRGGLIEVLNEELGHAIRPVQPESDSITPTESATPRASVDPESA